MSRFLLALIASRMGSGSQSSASKAASRSWSGRARSGKNG